MRYNPIPGTPRQLQTAPQGKAPALPAPFPRAPAAPLLRPSSSSSFSPALSAPPPAAPAQSWRRANARLRVAAPRHQHTHRERNSKKYTYMHTDTYTSTYETRRCMHLRCFDSSPPRFSPRLRRHSESTVCKKQDKDNYKKRKKKKKKTNPQGRCRREGTNTHPQPPAPDAHVALLHDVVEIGGHPSPGKLEAAGGVGAAQAALPAQQQPPGEPRPLRSAPPSAPAPRRAGLWAGLR